MSAPSTTGPGLTRLPGPLRYNQSSNLRVSNPARRRHGRTVHYWKSSLADTFVLRFRARRAHLRARARAFHDGAPHRRPRADVLVGLWTQDPEVHARRYRVLRQCDPARWLRED